MKDDGRIFWLDVTRVVAIFGVVLLHVAAPHLYKFGTISADDWHIANLIDAFTRPSVPLFFMVSGALLLAKPIDFSTLKRRLFKLIIPLIVWSIVYLVLLSFTDPNFNLTASVLRAPIKPVIYHLWFLYAMIGLYICLPLIAPMIQAARPSQLYYGLGLWVLASSIIPMLEPFLAVKSSIELSTMAGYMGYMVLGYVLANAPSPERKHVFGALVMIIIGYLATAFFTDLLSSEQERFMNLFYGYMSPNVILFSTGLFVIIRAAFEGQKSFVIKGLSDLSFGIYLCHVAVLIFADMIIDVRGWWIIPFAALVFAISTMTAFVLQKFLSAKVLSP